MHAPLHSARASSAYRQVGLETDVGAASAHHLITMLYDGFADAVARARGAMQAGRIDEKGRAIAHAVRIVEEGLRAGLDARRGGAVAANLESLYGYVSLRLTEANLHNDAAALDECARLIDSLRGAWREIAPRATPSAPR